MDEDENLSLDLTIFPRQGMASQTREVVFGPESDVFALLYEIDPATHEFRLTVGNSPAASQIPTTLPDMLRELADQIEGVAETPEFLEFIYGSPQEDDD